MREEVVPSVRDQRCSDPVLDGVVLGLVLR